MSGWPVNIRDPVHNIISFEDNALDRLLLALINTKEFQRLRRIKQLGMSELVFPGTNHSRFSHSIGVMNVARIFVERLEKILGAEAVQQQKDVLLVAALLHDVGHGPFSHAFEKITQENHENRSREIIEDASTEVNQKLRSYNEDFPNRLIAFLDGNDIFSQVISSQLDADRFDYLLRDSFSSGTEYGHFDFDWIIRHLNVDQTHNRFFLSHKAFLAAETYLFARYHMYRIVYFHKTTRSAEVMLKLIFQRYKELLDAKETDEEKKAVVPEVSSIVLSAFSSNGNMALSDYLLLDDYNITDFFKACLNAQDSVLRELGQGLLDRKLYKCIDTSDVQDQATIQTFKQQAEQHISQYITNNRLNQDISKYLLVSDKASDTPYKPYDPDADHPATQLYVKVAGEELREISQISEPIKPLQRKYNLLRFYFPERLREGLKGIASQTLK
ncbi:MAG: HD domain-containing protein [Oligoflexales bacterium]